MAVLFITIGLVLLLSVADWQFRFPVWLRSFLIGVSLAWGLAETAVRAYQSPIGLKIIPFIRGSSIACLPLLSWLLASSVIRTRHKIQKLVTGKPSCVAGEPVDGIHLEGPEPNINISIPLIAPTRPSRHGSLTPEQRTEIAQYAAHVRWKRRR